MMWTLFIWASLLLMSIAHWVYSWRNPKCRGKLPPGSMGFPLLGETIQFFKPNTTSDIPPFVKERVKKYGPIFKTNLVGRPVIVSTDPDLSYFVFQQEGRCFQSWYPDTFTNIFGRKNVGSLHGFMYKYLKSMVLTLFGYDGLKKMLPQVELTANKRLELWSNQECVELKDATASMIFDLTAKKLISHDPDKSSENLRANFVAFIQGLISFPFNIPGTAYHKCLKGRENAMRMLRNMLQERRKKPRKNPSDFFDYVIEEVQKEGTILTEEIALDLMFVLLFASFETTSLALTLAIKFLSDDPAVLKRLTQEHETILRNREDADSGLTWEEYKSMTYTFQFINETARLANIVPAIFRKALIDIKFKDYTIPAGWAVMVCPPAVHLNPDKYEDPLVFNPSRWEESNSNNASKHFMAFGGGMRFCVGTDFTKLQMAVFLHSLVTKYRWEEIKGGNILRTPGLQFPNGYHVERSVAYNEHRPRTPPPDLPSMLLDGRIVYIGMPLVPAVTEIKLCVSGQLVPAVTELVVAELMYLQWLDPKEPIYTYINSTGTTRDDGETVHTVCVGAAIGQACLLLSAGTKGKRFMMPHAKAMIQQPHVPSSGLMPASDVLIRAKEIITNRDILVELLSKHTGNSVETVANVMRRPYYMDAPKAKEFGVIDRILYGVDKKRLLRTLFPQRNSTRTRGLKEA